MTIEDEKIEPAFGGLGPDAGRTSSTDQERQETDSDAESTEQERGRVVDEKSHRAEKVVEEEDVDIDEEAQEPPYTVPTRVHSRASSARSRPLSIVPRSKRRGLFGQFAVLPEVDRPYDYSDRTKWMITTIVALAAAGAPIGSSIFYREPQKGLQHRGP
jgi:hypothetical protein